MATLKTQRSHASVPAFIKSVDNDQRCEDASTLLEIIQQVSKMTPKLWGASVIGFGEYHYESERSSRKGEWPLTGFSPRKRNMSVYIMPGFADYQDLLSRIGVLKSAVKQPWNHSPITCRLFSVSGYGISALMRVPVTRRLFMILKSNWYA